MKLSTVSSLAEIPASVEAEAVMISDIRLVVTFPYHHKTIKLKRRLGAEGVLSLVYLWQFVAQNKSKGVLSGMDAEDIAIAAQWGGDCQKFVDELVNIGFLDKNKDEYAIHNWERHNAYAAAAEARSEQARKAAIARWEAKNKANESWKRDQGTRLGT